VLRGAAVVAAGFAVADAGAVGAVDGS